MFVACAAHVRLRSAHDKFLLMHPEIFINSQIFELFTPNISSVKCKPDGD